MFRSNLHRDNDNERGHAFLEIAITLPFLLLLVSATVDLGRAANQYLNVRRVVYEGARYAVSHSALEMGYHDTANRSLPQGHYEVQNRVRFLLDRYGVPGTSVSGLSTELYKNANDQLEVRVRLQLSFEPFFEQFGSLRNLGAEATGPYLFANAG